MLDRENRFRVVGVALLAVGVMVGVVASALVAKSHAEGAPAKRTGSTGPRPIGKGRHEIPDDCRADPKAPPVLRFDGLSEGPKGPLLDLGALRQGQSVERTVDVRNAGTGDLCVVDVSAGCGCVKVEVVGPARAKPGEVLKVRVKIDTEHREGEVSKEVSVWSNDPAKREAKFTVKVDVRLGLIVDKAGLYFGRRAVGKPGTDEMRLRAPRGDGTAWTVTAVTGTKSTYAFETKEIEPNDPAFRQVLLTISRPAEAKPGYVDDDVTIATSHPDRPVIKMRGQMMVLDRVQGAPQKIVFGYVGGASGAPAGSTITRQAYITAADLDVPFVLTSVKVEGEGFEALEPKKSPAGWVIDLRYDGKARAAGTLVEATLVVESKETPVAPADGTAAKEPEPLPVVRIPLSATVR